MKETQASKSTNANVSVDVTWLRSERERCLKQLVAENNLKFEPTKQKELLGAS